MKNIVCLLLIGLIFGSCAQRYTLKGTYREAPYAIPAKKDPYLAWLQVQDFMSQEKIIPRFLKKKKYLIITEPQSFKDDYTNENTEGTLVDSTKYVVLPIVKNNAPLISATAHWIVKVSTHKKKATVLIELSKVVALYDTKGETTKLIGNKVSTGVFEKKMEAYILSHLTE